VARFFIPGLDDETSAAEAVYTDMRQRLELDLGRLPHPRRIQELWTRRGRTDCVTKVGTPDPLSGDTVIAIFDMGSHQPFVIWHERHDAARAGEYEVLGPNAYSVLEFDS
jgi:hypothetical protein